MGDITDLFVSNARTKTTPTKVYQASFSTTSTIFVDVTGLSLSVPNNAFYVIRGVFTNDANGGTQNLQVLQGASVVFSDSISSTAPAVASKNSDSLILQNISGSTQTVKVQIKTDATAGSHAIVNTMSIIQGSFILPFDSNRYALQEIYTDVSSIDFVSCLGNGVSYVSYDGTQITDNITTAVTYKTLEKVVNKIEFITNLSVSLQIGAGTSPATVIIGAGYVAYDFSGKYLTL